MISTWKKRPDKGSTTVVMNKTDKIKEGESLLNDEQSYKLLTALMLKESHNKVMHLITDLHRENYFDDMTKWHDMIADMMTWSLQYLMIVVCFFLNARSLK